MRTRATGGFTLVELIVVIAIIGLLVALLFPSFGQVTVTVNSLLCQNNLNNIGKAYGLRAADERDGTVSPLAVGGWASALSAYVEKADLFFCPVGPTASNTGPGGLGGGPRRLIVYSDPVGSSPIPGQSLPPGWMQWDDVNVWLEGDRGADALVKNVVPGVSYELWFEDSWHNNTWNDLQLRITINPDQSETVTYTGEATGAYHYALCDGDSKAYLMPTDFPTHWMGVGGSGQIGFGATIALDAPTSNTNYGMNSLAAGDRGCVPGHRVILAFDYLKTVARGPTDIRKDDWQLLKYEAADGTILFARHSGFVNVLWSDGSVDSMDPRDFDPMGPPSLATRYWDAEAGP